MSGREHTDECYERGCTNGQHPAPRPGHVTGGPWTPSELLAWGAEHHPGIEEQFRRDMEAIRESERKAAQAAATTWIGGSL